MGDASAKPVNLDNEKTGKNEIARKDDTLDADEVIGEFENLPNHERHTVTREITQMMMGVARQENPIVKKITPEHIDKYLDGTKLELQESYKGKHERKIFNLLILIVALVFIIVLTWMLKDNEAILEKILYTLGGLVAGAFGGYGYGKKSNEDE